MASNLSKGIPEIPGRFKLQGFAPDVDPITPGAMLDCGNLYATSKGFRAYPSLVDHSLNAMGGACLGNWAGVLGTSFLIAAGTANRLYVFNNSTRLFVDQGLALSAQEWDFAAYGQLLIAVDGVDTPKVYTGAGPFTNLGGSPPIASMAEPTDYSLFLIVPDSNRWWSSLSATIWTPSIATATVTGTLDSTPGPITAAHKLRDGIGLYKAQALHMGRYIGPPFFWEFPTISAQVGSPGKRAVAGVGDAHYWPSNDDFYRFDGYNLSTIPNALKEWFFDNLDGDFAYRIASRWDQRRNLIFWHFPSIEANPVGTLDKWICLNTRTGQWTADTAAFNIDQPIFSPVDVATLTYGTFVSQYPTYGSIPSNLTYGALRPQNQQVSGVIASDHTLKVYNGHPGRSFFKTHYLGNHHDMFQVSRIRPEFSRYPDSAIVNVEKQYTPGIDSAPVALNRPISADGWFNVLTTARLQRFKIDMTGDAEIKSMEVMCEYAGER